MANDMDAVAFFRAESDQCVRVMALATSIRGINGWADRACFYQRAADLIEQSVRRDEAARVTSDLPAETALAVEQIGAARMRAIRDLQLATEASRD